MMEKLFVYGTLAPNCPNEDILKKINGSWQDAIVMGNLKEEGWGAKMGYPGIELNKSVTEIKGYIFKSKNLSNHWNILDNFEGNGYERVITQAKLKDGSIVDTYIYILRNCRN